MNGYILSGSATDTLINLPETGSGYQIIDLPQAQQHMAAGCYIVFNAELAILFSEYESFLNGLNPQDLPAAFETYESFKLSVTVSPVNITSLSGISLVAPPPGPPGGPPPVVGKWPKTPTLVVAATTKVGELFWRVSTHASDPRLVGGHFTPGTYATSNLDMAFVNTGFGAVGRYALPSPFPSNYVYLITPAVGTAFDVGTSRPSFGQAGGGVEVLFTTAAAASFSRLQPPW
ncbi:MAG: hypothetical protein JWQ02_2937 [Capsulimonas sp.]|nr:hypothetical protein [Capsulimonas sp.]